MMKKKDNKEEQALKKLASYTIKSININKVFENIINMPEMQVLEVLKVKPSGKTYSKEQLAFGKKMLSKLKPFINKKLK